MKNIRSSHKNYKEISEDPIDISTYCKIVNDFNKFIMANVFNGNEVVLPSRLGTLSIKGKKVDIKFDEKGRLKGHAPDYQATKELWEKCPECKENKQMVFHLNEHTNGIRYKFFWSKNRVLVENKTFYNMIFTRTNKRLLSKLIKDGREYYVEPKTY